jgi:isopentenyl diphosphate isomerase/L-lactate dehydrogenase-like FMN-dependent dehydrogenase
MSTSKEPATAFQYFAWAKANLSPGTWDYLMGGSETETTLNRNRWAIDSVAFRPRVLRDVSSVDTSTTLFGHKMRIPVMLAPIGSLQDIIAEGAIIPTRAAASFGTLHMMSSVAHPGLEAVAHEVDHPKFFQLYVRGDADWVDEIIARAIDNGFSGIALTVDRARYSRRDRDVAKGHTPTARKNAAAGSFQESFAWKDVERIRRNINVPLMLKGIGTAEDSMLAVEHGVDGVYISNHGGRQLDHCDGAVGLVREIADAVSGRATIIVDGCILRGTDVVKALSLGASAVAIGRLQGIALGAGGEAALVRVLEILEEEIVSCMGLLGACSVAELGPHCIKSAVPLGRARNWIDSAFPLISEGYGKTDIADLQLKLPGEV